MGVALVVAWASVWRTKLSRGLRRRAHPHAFAILLLLLAACSRRHDELREPRGAVTSAASSGAIGAPLASPAGLPTGAAPAAGATQPEDGQWTRPGKDY